MHERAAPRPPMRLEWKWCDDDVVAAHHMQTRLPPYIAPDVLGKEIGLDGRLLN